MKIEFDKSDDFLEWVYEDIKYPKNYVFYHMPGAILAVPQTTSPPAISAYYSGREEEVEEILKILEKKGYSIRRTSNFSWYGGGKQKP